MFVGEKLARKTSAVAIALECWAWMLGWVQRLRRCNIVHTGCTFKRFKTLAANKAREINGLTVERSRVCV